MFLGFSKFTVANDMADEVAAAFLKRPHLVDEAPGFVRMEVVRASEQPGEFWLLTWWHLLTLSSDLDGGPWCRSRISESMTYCGWLFLMMTP